MLPLPLYLPSDLAAFASQSSVALKCFVLSTLRQLSCPALSRAAAPAWQGRANADMLLITAECVRVCENVCICVCVCCTLVYVAAHVNDHQSCSLNTLNETILCPLLWLPSASDHSYCSIIYFFQQ